MLHDGQGPREDYIYMLCTIVKTLAVFRSIPVTIQSWAQAHMAFWFSKWPTLPIPKILTFSWLALYSNKPTTGLSVEIKGARHPRSQQVSGRRPLTCWDLGFESHRGHGYLSVVSVVCCQVEVSATSWSPVQRNPTDCAASLCVI